MARFNQSINQSVVSFLLTLLYYNMIDSTSSFLYGTVQSIYQSICRLFSTHVAILQYDRFHFFLSIWHGSIYLSINLSSLFLLTLLYYNMIDSTSFLSIWHGSINLPPRFFLRLLLAFDFVHLLLAVCI